MRPDANRAEVARLVASISGTPERATGALLKNLPAVVPITRQTALSTEVQQLTRLGVDARAAQPTMDIVDISKDLRHELQRSHQLVIWDATVGDSRVCHCHRCGHNWRTKKAAGEKVPRYCPNCGSTAWSKRRLFKCAWCSHEFETPDLTEDPLVLFPHCPSCGLGNWLTGTRSVSRSRSAPVVATQQALPLTILPITIASAAIIILVLSHPAFWPLLFFLGFGFFGRPPRRSGRRRH